VAAHRVKSGGMLFNSPIFLFVFLPATVALYLVVRQISGPRGVLGLLLTASIVFYGWWNPAYVPLLLGLALFNFLTARGITACRRAGQSTRVSWLLTFGIVVDLTVLGYFKYTDFLIDTANVLVTFRCSTSFCRLASRSSRFRRSLISSTPAAAMSSSTICSNIASS
jgi:D-alanyl-lipoteichoic acid acyltransferase DltB (MBOAT superfamily)